MQLTPSPLWRSPLVELFALRVEDVDDRYLAWMHDPLVMRFLESRFDRHSRESLIAFVRHSVNRRGELLLGIRSVPMQRRHVGNIKIGTIDWNHRIADVGIMLGEREAWGHGIATEAIRLVCAIARDELGLRKLSAGCYAANEASRGAFEHAGFEVEAMRRAHMLLEGRPEDVVVMGKLLAEPVTGTH